MAFILDGFTVEDVDEKDLEASAGMISMMAISLLNQFPSFYFDKEDWEELSETVLEILERAKLRVDEHVKLEDGQKLFETESTYNTFYVMKAKSIEEAREDAEASFGEGKVKIVRECTESDAKLYLKEMGFIPEAGV